MPLDNRSTGLTPWPELFHNFRASRQTELPQTYPIHVVCTWLGNAVAEAAGHYLQTVEEHHVQGAGGSGQEEERGTESGTVSGRQRLSAVDHGPVEMQENPCFQGLSTADNHSQTYLLPPRGLEPLAGAA
jgi:hypothetical protein